MWQFFVYDKKEKVSRCSAEDCSHAVADKNTGNAKVHLKTHPKLGKKFKTQHVQPIQQVEVKIAKT